MPETVGNADSLATDSAEMPPLVQWRIECRACEAWLVTHLPDDIRRWLEGHKHG